MLGKNTIVVLITLLLNLVYCGCNNFEGKEEQPNIIILLADDVGYGDLSSYGHPTIKTPNLDKLAHQGVRFTSFVTGMWCLPSRIQLMTGRYLTRVDLGGSPGVNGNGGLPESEVTLAEGLKQIGYSTGMAGKWHLGHIENRFLPTNQGFDSWLGLPYSNDMRKPWVQTERPLGLYRDTEMIEHPVNQDSLTIKYTEEAIEFIEESSSNEEPFFFYLAYSMAHLPIHTTKEFQGKSRGGFYGDVIETIDWSVGRILQVLENQNIVDNTIVFFASDNGPWLNLPDRMLQEGNKPWHQGTAGLLRGYKRTSYEGGTRVPAMIRWPKNITAGQVTDALVAMPDVYRTVFETTGAKLPDHAIDGFNLLPFLSGERKEPPRKDYFYFRFDELRAYRNGQWKLRLVNEEPELFNLQIDPGERWNRAEDNPLILQQLHKKMEMFAQEVGATLPN